MTYRTTPLVIGQTYHIFNRSIAKEPIFLNKRNYLRALELIDYYRFQNPGMRFSHFNRLDDSKKIEFKKNLKEKNAQVSIFAFTLMPNHFHFLSREETERGISTFLSNFQNSYAKYFNLKNSRSGAVFQSMFKAKLIETDEQLIHLCRYIHLNPITSYVLKNIGELENYQWGSYRDYVGQTKRDFVETKMTLGLFENLEKFKKFTKDQIDYRRRLNLIKHLALDS